MALIKCKECGNQVSSKAASCPKCGAKPKKKTSLLAWVVLVVIGVPLVVGILSPKAPKPDKSNTAEKAVTAKATLNAPFVESDFYWDEKTSKYKDLIIKGVNKIAKDNAKCKHPDPSSAYISTSKGTASNPFFYVTCNEPNEQPFNVFFSKTDIEAGSKLQAKRHIVKSAAHDLCEQYAKNNATDPSTVKYSRIMDAVITEHPNGNTTVVSSFTAKNKFNLELKFKISCLLNANGMIEANISE